MFWHPSAALLVPTCDARRTPASGTSSHDGLKSPNAALSVSTPQLGVYPTEYGGLCRLCGQCRSELPVSVSMSRTVSPHPAQQRSASLRASVSLEVYQTNSSGHSPASRQLRVGDRRRHHRGTDQLGVSPVPAHVSTTALSHPRSTPHAGEDRTHPTQRGAASTPLPSTTSLHSTLLASTRLHYPSLASTTPLQYPLLDSTPLHKSIRCVTMHETRFPKAFNSESSHEKSFGHHDRPLQHQRRA